MMENKKLLRQAENNLIKLGYKRNLVEEIIATIKRNPNLIPYDNYGKVEYITLDDFIFNKEAITEYFKANKDKLVYMMLPTVTMCFQQLHTFLCTMEHTKNEDLDVKEYGKHGFYASALVFNSTNYENSELGDVLLAMTKQGLIREG